MIDQFRKEIQDRLNQLHAEADKLRRALVALGGVDGSAPADPAPRTASAGTKGRGAARRTRRTSTGSNRAREQASRTRAVRGQTKGAVLAALSSGEAMTAAEVAAATGLGRATVSTTLSKLAKTGEVMKADRGYRRAGPSRAA